MKTISRMGLIVGCALSFQSCTRSGQADIVSTQPDFHHSNNYADGGMGSGTGRDYANGPRNDRDTRKPKATPTTGRLPAEEKLPDHSQMLKE